MDSVITVDSCIFIDHFRSKDKSETVLERLLKNHELCVSAIAKYEVLCGADIARIEFWQSTFSKMEVLPFDDSTIMSAWKIYRQLKNASCLIDTGDILIAASAIANDLPLATLNRKHFERIEGLKVV